MKSKYNQATVTFEQHRHPAAWGSRRARAGGNLISLPASLSCLQGQGFWGKGTLAELGWGNYSYSAEVSSGLYFVLPLSCSQVEEPVLRELWLLLSLCDPYRHTASASHGTGVPWEAKTPRRAPLGNSGPQDTRDQDDAYGAMHVQTACGEEKVA